MGGQAGSLDFSFQIPGKREHAIFQGTLVSHVSRFWIFQFCEKQFHLNFRDFVSSNFTKRILSSCFQFRGIRLSLQFLILGMKLYSTCFCVFQEWFAPFFIDQSILKKREENGNLFKDQIVIVLIKEVFGNFQAFNNGW